MMCVVIMCARDYSNKGVTHIDAQMFSLNRAKTNANLLLRAISAAIAAVIAAVAATATATALSLVSIVSAAAFASVGCVCLGGTRLPTTVNPGAAEAAGDDRQAALGSGPLRYGTLLKGEPTAAAAAAACCGCGG